MSNGFTVPDGTTLNAMEKAGAPRSALASLKSFYQSQLVNGSGEQSKVALAKLHVAAAGEAVRAGAEGALTGAALGALHVKLVGGLDAKIGTGQNIHQVPIDGLIGAAALAGAVFGATTPGGKDLQNVGTAALGVFAFRKTNDLMIDAAFKAAGATPGGGTVPASVAGRSKIGHPVIAGESRFGWAPGSAAPRGADWGEDPIATAARGV